MALVDDQDVPPSLLQAYATLLARQKTGVATETKAGILPSVRQPKPAKPQTARERFASYAAGWLRDAWLPNASVAERSVFFADRRAELLAGTFPTDWWYPCSLIEDKTEYCVPAVNPFEGDWDPNYNDPLRQPSSCIYQDASKVYNTPSPPGTESEPSPSWKGVVIDSIWRDLYHAQRRVKFALQYAMVKKDPRPVGLKVEATITATATVRGNRNWFALIAQPWFHRSIENLLPKRAAQTHWAYEDGYPYAIPDADPNGWTHQVTRTLIRAGQDKAIWSDDSNLTRLSLRLAAPPSSGRYGSRNDNVSVYHTLVATAAQAKAP